MEKKDTVLRDALREYAKNRLAEGNTGLNAQEMIELINSYMNHVSIEECSKNLRKSEGEISLLYYGMSLEVMKHAYKAMNDPE